METGRCMKMTVIAIATATTEKVHEMTLQQKRQLDGKQ